MRKLLLAITRSENTLIIIDDLNAPLVRKLKLDYELLPKEATNQNVLWISSDESIATV